MAITSSAPKPAREDLIQEDPWEDPTGRCKTSSLPLACSMASHDISQSGWNVGVSRGCYRETQSKSLGCQLAEHERAGDQPHSELGLSFARDRIMKQRPSYRQLLLPFLGVESEVSALFRSGFGVSLRFREAWDTSVL